MPKTPPCDASGRTSPDTLHPIGAPYSSKRGRDKTGGATPIGTHPAAMATPPA